MKTFGKAGEHGTSILELIVGATVAIVFALAAWSFQRQQAIELGDQAARLEATERIRGAMAFLSREIRRAGSDPRLTALIVPGTKGINEARSDRILIQWDANANGVIDPTATDPAAESVLYGYDADTRRILRTVNGVTETLIENVPASGFGLEYFDLLGNPLTMTGTPPVLDAVKRDLVAFVRVNLRVDTAGSSREETLRLSSRVTVRQRILDKL